MVVVCDAATSRKPPSRFPKEVAQWKTTEKKRKHMASKIQLKTSFLRTLQ